MDKLLNLLSQPSTWSGIGIVGSIAIMLGVPIVQIQQVSAVVISGIGVYNILRDENKGDK